MYCTYKKFIFSHIPKWRQVVSFQLTCLTATWVTDCPIAWLSATCSLVCAPAMLPLLIVLQAPMWRQRESQPERVRERARRCRRLAIAVHCLQRFSLQAKRGGMRALTDNENSDNGKRNAGHTLIVELCNASALYVCVWVCACVCSGGVWGRLCNMLTPVCAFTQIELVFNWIASMLDVALRLNCKQNCGETK